MEQTCEIVGEVAGLKGVVQVRVPGIYGKKGDPLPQRYSKLVRKAAQSLAKVYADVRKEGGHLYMSDMFRSATDQQKAHQDFISGRKSSFSPPSCSSVHEAGRAIDIDAFDTKIGHKRVRAILRKHGWSNIVDTLTGSECWHYEFREAKWQAYRNRHGAQAMAHAMKMEIGNRVGAVRAAAGSDEVKWLQSALNTLIGTKLKVDGLYGDSTKAACKRFQQKHKLQVDGVAGPITKARIRELLRKQLQSKKQVKSFQEALNTLIGAKLEVDGVYGALTKAACERFQRKHKLPVDGVADPVTLAKVQELLRAK